MKKRYFFAPTANADGLAFIGIRTLFDSLNNGPQKSFEVLFYIVVNTERMVLKKSTRGSIRSLSFPSC